MKPAEASSTVSGAAPAPEPAGPEPMPVDILLVDDEVRNLDVLESILYAPGYRLVRANSANEALLALVRGEFAVLVLDINMPDLNGIELANLIKQRKRTRHIPIIFLTAYYSDEKYALEGYGVGAVDYLTKPVNAEILRMKVAVFVELHRKSVALAESNRMLQLEVAQRQRSEELLRVANAELERRVDERTLELSSSNSALRASEHRLRDTLSLMPAGVYTTDKAGRITFCNAAAVTLWGREPRLGVDQWCGSPRLFRLDGTPLPADQSPLAIALKEGRALRGHEMVIERTDGTRRHVMPYPEPLRDPAGAIVGAINMLVDVTEEKVAVDALRRHEERTSQLMALMPAGVFACDAAGRITFYNRRAVELWGRAPTLNSDSEKYFGCHRLLLPDGAYVRPESGPMAAAVNSGQSFRNLEVKIERPDGARFHASVNIDVLRNPQDQITGAICVFQDISERKEAEQRAEFLNQLGRQLAPLAEAGDIIRNTCRAVGEYLNVERCYFCFWQEDLQWAMVTDDWHPPGSTPLTGVHDRDEFGPPEWWREMAGGHAQVEDLETEPTWRNRPSLYRSMGIRSCATSRGARNDSGMVTLGVASSRPRRWTQHELVLLEHVAARVWPSVERARAADALKAKERQLRLVTDIAPIMLLQCDADGRFIFANQAYFEKSGLTREQVIGRPLQEVLGEKSYAQIEPYLARVRAGESARFELELDYFGRGRFIGASFVPELDRSGRVRGWVAAMSDVTDRKRTHDAARQLAAIVEYSEDAIISKNLDGIIMTWNRGAEKLFGYTAAEAIGRPVLMLIPPERRIEEPQILERIRRGETVDHFETLRQRKDGSLVEISLTISPILDDAGNIVGASKISRDISEQKASERALQAAQDELKQHAQQLEERVRERTASLTDAITQMEEFSYTVSHDLRAPLRAMNSYADALLQDYSPQLDATARDYLVRIQRSSQRMEKLTHDMLMYSRLARSEVKIEPLDLNLLVRDLINQYEEFQPPRATLEVRHPLAPVMGHEVSLGQCIANLLTNAVKFMPPGTLPVIRIYTEERDRSVRLWIEDNGIGIPPQYHARIFEVFERLHGREKYEGTGMGLAIVRKVMEKTGGKCGVESDGVKGSRFWLEMSKT